MMSYFSITVNKETVRPASVCFVIAESAEFSCVRNDILAVCCAARLSSEVIPEAVVT